MLHSSNPPASESWPVQRRSVRIPLNVRVRLRYEREHMQQQCHCRSYDISDKGMGLMSPYELELGQVVDLEFSLPESTAPLKLRAVIRSKVGFRLGCEFISPTVKQQTKIANYEYGFQPPKFS